MQTSNLHPNVRAIRAHAMFGELSFMIPVIIMFAQWRGVSFTQFMAIQGVFSVAMLLLTPLVSPLADKYGRRPAAIIGSLFWMLGHVVIWLGYGWESYAIAEILLGLGVAVSRPAIEALLYDSLIEVKRTDAHLTARSQQVSALSYAGAVAMLFGGWMYTFHPTLPVIGTVLSNLAMVAMAWRMKEVPYHSSIADKTPTYREMWKQVWEGLSGRQTRWLVILPGLVTGNTIVLFWAIQPTLINAGVGPVVTSFMLAAYFVGRGWFAGKCPKLAKRFTGRQCLFMCVVALGIGFVSVALLPWWAAFPPFVLGSGFAYILADSQGKELAHRHVNSAVRSTGMGGVTFVSRFIGTVSLTATSLLQPLVGLSTTLLVIGGTAVVLALAGLTRLPRETDQPTQEEAPPLAA